LQSGAEETERFRQPVLYKKIGVSSFRPRGFLGNVRRLVKHRAIYPAVLIMFLWNFMPGS
jgi:hypothetical protein